MINVSVKNDSEDWYMVDYSILLGPIQFSDEETSFTEKIRHPIDTIREARCFFHENYVYNVQVEADLNFQSTLSQVVPTPTPTYPDGITFHGRTWRGLGTNGAVIKYFDSYTHYAAIAVSEDSIVVRKIFCRTSDGRVYGGQVVQYERFAKFGTASVTRRKHYASVSYGSPYTRVVPPSGGKPSWEQIAAWCPDIPTGYSTGNSIAYVYGCLPYDTAMSVVDRALTTILTTPFGPQLVPYGDLAQEASEKFSAVKVNMLEFLSEIVNPVKLIEQLRNLRKLKDLASLYLGTHYGVLPTISDLKSLYRSAVRQKPFVDRNGYQTTSAGRIFYDQIGEVHQVLEQHVKLAIDNEDSDFLELIRGTESLGILPTLANVWDLIPLSFVVDWFLKVGDFLERVDTLARVMRFNVKYVTLSHKRTCTMELIPSNTIPFSGSVKHVRYWRSPQAWCPTPELTFSQPESPTSHWLEGAALYIVRRK